jgi:hypothetical protein
MCFFPANRAPAQDGASRVAVAGRDSVGLLVCARLMRAHMACGRSRIRRWQPMALRTCRAKKEAPRKGALQPQLAGHVGAEGAGSPLMLKLEQGSPA